MNRPIEELIEFLGGWEDFSLEDFEALDRMRREISQEISTLDNMVNDIRHFVESTVNISDSDKVAIYNLFHNVLIVRRDYKNKKSIIDPLMTYGNLKKRRSKRRRKEVPTANRNRTKELFERAVNKVSNNYNYYTRVLKSTFGEVISKDKQYFKTEIKNIPIKSVLSCSNLKQLEE